MVDRYSCNNRSSFRNNTNFNRNADSFSRGCGCNKSNTSNSCNSDRGECAKLLKKLQVLDFSIIDTVLYLDAYPDCKEALKYYHKLVGERKGIVEALANTCHMPTTIFDNESCDGWNWTDSPWPWEPTAN